MKALKSLLFLSLVLFFVIVFSASARAEDLTAPIGEISLAVDLLPAPILIAPNQTTITAKVKPLIIGLTQSGSLVKVYIDDVYNGKTEILYHDSQTANFAYRPFLNLSRGWHKVYALAEDSSGRTSQISEVLYFKIELPMPAPTMLKPVVNKKTSSSRPFIVGLAKNDSKIKVYIDKKYDGEFTVKNHDSGTANFAYQPVKPLIRGSHLVYAVAIDKRGKESSWSNLVYFSARNSAITQAAAAEESQAAARIEEPKTAAKTDEAVPVISGSSGVIEKKSTESAASEPEEQLDAIKQLSQPDQASLEKIKNLLGADMGEKATTGQGMINEGRLNQGKIKLSVAVFILFLIGVVAWLLWVNRELIKERRTQNEADEQADKDKNDPMAGGQMDKLL